MEESLKDVNALTLAYVGDAVFELMVRTYMLEHGSGRVEKLHKKVTDTVNAGRQSQFVARLEPIFTEEELAVFHRGRNAKAMTAARHQSILDYRRATGLEAVFGYLYLKGEYERMKELLLLCLSDEETTEHSV
ncbi:MAG: ribonuclease III [Lachnospiraceae bacterium]|nr:ribonuclease III [Candidatus Hippenecus merdae]MCQ2414858.1 ribonuclease III [Lachnospiraceae bacterium]